MAMAHLPTRIERMSNMSDEMELELCEGTKTHRPG